MIRRETRLRGERERETESNSERDDSDHDDEEAKKSARPPPPGGAVHRRGDVEAMLALRCRTGSVGSVTGK